MIFRNYETLLEKEYESHSVDVAQKLLGKLLLRRVPLGWMGGFIHEAEAYEGEDDLGCHAKAGKTLRTAVMYGLPGRAYIYFTYGMHWMLNAVTGVLDHPGAVLIRGIYPAVGLDLMDGNRPRNNTWNVEHPSRSWTDGPAKICQALGLNGKLNGTSLVDPDGEILIVDAGVNIPKHLIKESPRIGLFTVPEPWKSIPWNWKVEKDYQFPQIFPEELGK